MLTTHMCHHSVISAREPQARGAFPLSLRDFYSPLLLGAVLCPATATSAHAALDQAQLEAELRTAQRRIEDLQAQVESLRALVMAQQHRPEPHRQAEAAAPPPGAALAEAPAPALAATPARPRAKASDATVDPATRLSGRMFFNVSTIDSDAPDGGADKISGFAVKRVYVGVDHRFDDRFAANITLDADNVVRARASNDASANGTVQGFYIKKAYLEAKLDPALIVRAGAADMAWVPYAESVAGFRYIDQMMVDRLRLGTSADWGVHLLGRMANGLISYQVSAVDGDGFRQPQLSGTIDLEGRLSFRYKGIEAGIGGYSGKLGANSDGARPYRRAERLNALLAYKTDLFTIGGEYLAARNWGRVLASAPRDEAEAWGLFGSYAFRPDWALFGRFEWSEPNQRTRPTVDATYFNIGLQYSPIDAIDLALVYKRDEADNGRVTTGAGAIGGAAGGARNEVGLYGQFRF